MNRGTDIYSDIAARTQGDIYIGVVGPVRTGKSTLIKRIMETLVLPKIENSELRTRANDELPQSASGKTIMTTEPKFVPEDACEITLDEKTKFKIRLIDCVGYMVEGAVGHTESEQPRMVMTPWSEGPMPFEKAAEIGTRKVISEHSTISIAVTTDGSICEIPRANYVDAERRVITELSSEKKPFVLLLNSAHPKDAATLELAGELEAEYSCPVFPVNCFTLDLSETEQILSKILTQFPPKELSVIVPGWISKLEDTHPLKTELFDSIVSVAHSIKKNGDIKPAFEAFFKEKNELIDDVSLIRTEAGTGFSEYRVSLSDKYFYSTLGESCGLKISDDEELFSVMRDLSEAKGRYDKIAAALADVERTGYGIVAPSICDLKLEKPEIVRQGSGYGVKLRASAPSVHMIKANIATEVSPIVGSEKQSEDMVKFLLKEFEEEPDKIWETNMFGKTLHELVGEGMNAKLAHMSSEARMKLCDTMSRIINEGSGGLICIIL